MTNQYILATYSMHDNLKTVHYLTTWLILVSFGFHMLTLIKNKTVESVYMNKYIVLQGLSLSYKYLKQYICNFSELYLLLL